MVRILKPVDDHGKLIIELEKGLSQEQIEKAKKKRVCPFCGGDQFAVPIDCSQELWFDKDGDPEFGDIEAMDQQGYDTVWCRTIPCRQVIPEEIWKAWLYDGEGNPREVK